MERNIALLIEKYNETNDDECFCKLLEKFKPLLNYYARKLFYLDYEDSFQELSIALFDAVINAHDTDNEYACISYIEKSIINKFTKLYHKSKDAQQKLASYTTFDPNSNLDDSVFHIDNCISKIDLEQLLRSKTPLERKILSLIIMGYSDKEIASIIGYTPQYINRLKKRIL